MRVSRYNEIPWVSGFGGRGGENGKPDSYEKKLLFQGDPTEPGNFDLSVLHYIGKVYTPRHRHNFDQIRFPLVGKENYGPTRDLPERCVGFFPEGVHYGPQDKEANTEMLLLQFEGASRSGYVNSQQLRAARVALEKKGEYKNGVYSWVDEKGTKHNKDGHQAAWEYAMGKPLSYPAPRYAEPVILFPGNFQWQPIKDNARIKELGSFGEGRTHTRMLGLDSGSCSLPEQTQRTLAFVSQGTGTVGGQDVTERDAILLEPGERALFESKSGFEVLLVGLPKLAP